MSWHWTLSTAPKNIRKPLIFPCFSRGTERDQQYEMGKIKVRSNRWQMLRGKVVWKNFVKFTVKIISFRPFLFSVSFYQISSKCYNMLITNTKNCHCWKAQILFLKQKKMFMKAYLKFFRLLSRCYCNKWQDNENFQH